MKTSFYDKIKHHLLDGAVYNDIVNLMIGVKGIDEYGGSFTANPPKFIHDDNSIEMLSEQIFRTMKENKAKDFIVTFIEPFLYETGIYTIPRTAVAWKALVKS